MYLCTVVIYADFSGQQKEICYAVQTKKFLRFEIEHQNQPINLVLLVVIESSDKIVLSRLYSQCHCWIQVLHAVYTCFNT